MPALGRSVIIVLALSLVWACGDESATKGRRIPEVYHQKISNEAVTRFINEINKRQAIKPAVDPAKVKTHFQLVQELLPDDVLLPLFIKPKEIQRRGLLEYLDTLDDNGMLQTNCRYEMADCELVIHLTLLPRTNLKETMRKSWKDRELVRIEQVSEKDVFIVKGDGYVAGTVFGQQLLVNFCSRKRGQGSDFSMDEQRLWDVLQSVASRIE